MPVGDRHAQGWQDRQLTAHFQLGEFACDKLRSPPAAALGQLQSLIVMYLRPLRAVFGPVTILSACRSVRHNKAVGGATQSWHLWHVRGRHGVAVDVECETGRPEDWYSLLDQLEIPGLGLYDSWVHADNRSGSRARWDESSPF